MLPDDLMKKLLAEFRDEAGENIATAEAALLALEEDPSSGEAMNDLFRAVHSIKGSSSYLNLEGIAALAHQFESLLDLIRRQRDLTITIDLIDLSLSAMDHVKELVENQELSGISETARHLIDQMAELQATLADNPVAAQAPADKIPAHDPLNVFLISARQHVDSLLSLIDSPACPAVGSDDYGIIARAVHSLKGSARYVGEKRIEDIFVSIEKNLSLINEKTAIPDTWSEITQAIRRAARALDELAQQKNSAEGFAANVSVDLAQGERGSKPTLDDGFRIRQDELDQFMNMVGELIVARNCLQHTEREFEKAGSTFEARKVSDLTMTISQIADGLQRNVMRMRLLPAGMLFQRFRRLVRDLASRYGVSVQLVCQGEDTELDKGIADLLLDPLLHIVRNAIGHGIEPADQRLKSGKPEKAMLLMKAAQHGNEVVVEVIDDGRGIDRTEVIARAQDKGLISAEAGEGMTDSEVFDLLFEPGFSTCETVSELSGRGVGMDVVRTNMRKLGGRAEVESTVGEGTRICLHAPLTMAVIETLSVESAGAVYALPVHAAVMTTKIVLSDMQRAMGQWITTVKGQTMVVAWLAEVLNSDRQPMKQHSQLTCVVIRDGDREIALVVDRILGREDTLVKPLADYLATLPGISGGTITGDGAVRLILNPSEIIDLVAEPQLEEPILPAQS